MSMHKMEIARPFKPKARCIIALLIAMIMLTGTVVYADNYGYECNGIAEVPANDYISYEGNDNLYSHQGNYEEGNSDEIYENGSNTEDKHDENYKAEEPYERECGYYDDDCTCDYIVGYVGIVPLSVVYVSCWEQFSNAISDMPLVGSLEINLTADIAMTTDGPSLTEVGQERSITINGNGHRMLQNAHGRHFTIGGNNTLTLRNVIIERGTPAYLFGEPFPWSGGIQVSYRGHLIIEDGTVITGNISTAGGGVYISDDGVSRDARVTMNGGEISGNIATESIGGGIVIGYRGTFTMNGGTISGNTAAVSGGGIALSINTGGSVILNGGTISGNTAYGAGLSDGGGGLHWRTGSTLSSDVKIAPAVIFANNYAVSGFRRNDQMNLSNNINVNGRINPGSWTGAPDVPHVFNNHDIRTSREVIFDSDPGLDYTLRVYKDVTVFANDGVNVGEEFIGPGAVLGYTVIIENDGPASALNVEVQDTLAYLLPYITDAARLAPLYVEIYKDGVHYSTLLMFDHLRLLMDGIVIEEIAAGATVKVNFEVLLSHDITTFPVLRNEVFVNDLFAYVEVSSLDGESDNGNQGGGDTAGGSPDIGSGNNVGGGSSISSDPGPYRASGVGGAVSQQVQAVPAPLPNVLGYAEVQAANQFIDVNSSDWFFNAVMFVYGNDLMVGTNRNMFSPNTQLTRAMIVAILHRHAGSPRANGVAFGDVAEGTWYSDAVAWAAANGIVFGYGYDNFGANDNITRQDLAVILVRYADFIGMQLPAMGDNTGFSDQALVADYASEAVARLFKAGIISGRPGNVFDPAGNATRAEVAAMLYNFLN